jgi:hypothetical protein
MASLVGRQIQQSPGRTLPWFQQMPLREYPRGRPFAGFCMEQSENYWLKVGTSIAEQVKTTEKAVR